MLVNANKGQKAIKALRSNTTDGLSTTSMFAVFAIFWVCARFRNFLLREPFRLLQLSVNGQLTDWWMNMIWVNILFVCMVLNDNLQADESRLSRGSEIDNLSVNSNHRLPPADKTSGSKRLGQFLRRISASKPPGNAASLVSLNKVDLQYEFFIFFEDNFVFWKKIVFKLYKFCKLPHLIYLFLSAVYWSALLKQFNQNCKLRNVVCNCRWLAKWQLLGQYHWWKAIV